MRHGLPNAFCALHGPAEGWKREATRYKTAPEAPVTFADPTHENWKQEGRVSVWRGWAAREAAM